MITGTSDAARYRVIVSNGTHEIPVDTTSDKGGAGSPLGPHELLEAALASCLRITIRKYADFKGIPLTNVTSKVTLDRSQDGQSVFRYSYSFDGDLTDQQREGVHRIATACPVQKTLSNAVSFMCENKYSDSCCRGNITDSGP